VGDAVRREFDGLHSVRLCRDSGEVLRQFDFTECAGGPHELIGVKRSRLQQVHASEGCPLAVHAN